MASHSALSLLCSLGCLGEAQWPTGRQVDWEGLDSISICRYIYSVGQKQTDRDLATGFSAEGTSWGALSCRCASWRNWQTSIIMSTALIMGRCSHDYRSRMNISKIWTRHLCKVKGALITVSELRHNPDLSRLNWPLGHAMQMAKTQKEGFRKRIRVPREGLLRRSSAGPHFRKGFLCYVALHRVGTST